MLTSFERGYRARYWEDSDQSNKNAQWREGWACCDSELRNEEELSYAVAGLGTSHDAADKGTPTD